MSRVDELRAMMAQNRRELVKRRDEYAAVNPEMAEKMDKHIAAFDRQNLIFLSQVERDIREGREMARTILIWTVVALAATGVLALTWKLLL